jgi:hypothetical protein
VTFRRLGFPAGWRESFRPGALLFLLLFVSFAPLFWNSYVYHNDLGFWIEHSGSGYYESGHLFLIRRPLGAVLLNLQTAIAQLFPSLVLLLAFRLFTLVLVVCLGILVNRLLEQHTGLPRLHRAAFVAALLLQPSWLLTVMWTTNLIPGAIAYLAGLGGAIALDRVWARSPKLISRGMAVPALLIAASVLIYPPGALTFFWLPLIKVCFGTSTFRFRHFVRETVFFAAVSIVALTVDEVLIRPLACLGNTCQDWIEPGSTSYSLAPASDFVEKLGVLRDSLTTSLMSWANFAFDPLASSYPGIAAILILLLLTTVISIRQKKRNGTPIIVSATVILAILTGLNAANLVAKFSVVAFRTVSPDTILFGLILVAVLDSVRSIQIRKAIVGVCLAGCAVAAFGTAHHFTRYYSSGWHKLTSVTAAKNGCVLDPAGRTLQPEPELALFFQPQQSSAALHDFAYELFLPWTLWARCKVDH